MPSHRDGISLFLCESVNSRAAFCGNNKFLGVNVFASLQYRDKVTFYCLRSFCVVMTDKKGNAVPKWTTFPMSDNVLRFTCWW